MSTTDTESWARFSECRRYRYVLGRRWADGPSLVVVGHNPSTADETTDDRTISKCVGFAKRDGFGSLVMLNLCAWRDTDPNGLTLLTDPVGPENDTALMTYADVAGRIVAAWGVLHVKSKSQVVRERSLKVLRMLTQVADVYAFRLTKDRHPEHPLYLPGNVAPVLYRARVSP